MQYVPHWLLRTHHGNPCSNQLTPGLCSKYCPSPAGESCWLCFWEVSLVSEAVQLPARHLQSRARPLQDSTLGCWGCPNSARERSPKLDPLLDSSLWCDPAQPVVGGNGGTDLLLTFLDYSSWAALFLPLPLAPVYRSCVCWIFSSYFHTFAPTFPLVWVPVKHCIIRSAWKCKKMWTLGRSVGKFKLNLEIKITSPHPKNQNE